MEARQHGKKRRPAPYTSQRAPSGQQPSSAWPTSGAGQRQIKCYACGQIGHTTRQCTHSQDPKCFTCGKSGHMARSCPRQIGQSVAMAPPPTVVPTPSFVQLAPTTFVGHSSSQPRQGKGCGLPSQTTHGRVYVTKRQIDETVHEVMQAIAPRVNRENGETATQAGNELDKLYRARRETLDVLQQSARNQKSTPSSIASQEAKTMTMQYVDDFYFSALVDEDLFPISDEKYAEELQFQEVLTSSVLSRLPHQPVLSRAPSTGPSTSNLKRIRMETGKSSRTICSEKDTEEPQFQQVLTSSVLSCSPHQSVQSHAPSTRRSTRILKRSRMETGESSRTICGICMEEKYMVEMFRTTTCSHVFCSDCISKHVAAKIQENIAEVKCPGVNCRGVLEPEICRPIVPKEVFDRWEDALSESAVLASQRFYCPFKDCSALLVDDCKETIRESECPNCRRMFCAQCRVSWHSGVSCEEYQRLNEYERGREDLTLMELAKTKKWKRCPRCKYFVEKIEGCLHITCRCGFQFCYGCGLTWSDTHASCGSN